MAHASHDRGTQARPMYFPNILTGTSVDTPCKKRSLSDSTPVLEPSPKLKEPRTKDDDDLVSTPTKPQPRADLSARRLKLQMPSQEYGDSVTSNLTAHGYQSPQVEPKSSYESPSSVLPRHSRGLDFSRACTNLHHSTLPDPISPDSSPTVTQRSFIPPSRRGSTYSYMALDSPRMGNGFPWMGTPGERSFMPRSVGSTNAMTSEASSDSSDEEDIFMDDGDEDESMVQTPQVRKESNKTDTVTPYGLPSNRLGGLSTNESPISNAFINYRKNVFGGRRTRSRTASISKMNDKISPDTAKSNGEGQASCYFSYSGSTKSSPSRRESLSLGIGNVLHISSNGETCDDNPIKLGPMAPNVIRKPVTRRSNMLPKPKNMARIRAALQEESMPVDSEVKRESEVVRQVWANDVGVSNGTAKRSPTPELTPNIPTSAQDDSEHSSNQGAETKSSFDVTAKTNYENRRTSQGKDLFKNMYNRMQTPPPPFFNRHRSSSGISEDVNMDSPNISTPPSSVISTASIPNPDNKAETDHANSNHSGFQPPTLPSAAEVTRKIQKRRREDDFDDVSVKRRAVSPGVSVQSSPVVGQSPVSSSTSVWNPKIPREGSSIGSNSGSTAEERSASTGSAGHQTPQIGPKRVGLRGMTETSDSMMNMSIDT